MRTIDRSRIGVPALVMALVCLAGCASVPSGGRVVSGRSAERAEPIAEPYVRLVPVRPRRDWAPEDIVKGFLIASAAFDDDHEVAREYLTPAANAAWRPGHRPQVIVLQSAPSISPPPAVGAEALVEVAAARLGRIGSDGQYTAQPDTYTTSFGLARDSAGQWRIDRMPTDLQGGLLLDMSDVDRAFRVLNLYFFDPDGKVLVPNGIFLPLVNRQDLARQLVAALLAGPTGWLRPAVRSYFPPGTRLEGAGVAIADGVATVNLSAAAYPADHARMAAQLSWTLQRLPEVRRIKLQIAGETVEPAGRGPIQSTEDWEQYNSDTSRGGTEEIVYLRGPDGRPHQLLVNDATPAGTTGEDHLHRPALSPDQRIAGLDEAGDTVLSGDLMGGTPVRPVLETEHSDGRFTAPSWDPRGTLWSVELFRGGSTLWMRPGKGQQPVQVQQWELASHKVLALRVARDGVRVAAIVETDDGRQLRLGRIVRGPGGVVGVGEFLPIGSDLVDVTDLAWGDSNSLAVLGKTKATATQVTPYWVPVNGGGITPVGSGSLGEAKSITAAPGSRIVIGAEINGKNSICRQSDLRDWRFGEWKCDPLGSEPTYWS
ncbi:Sporulation and spore germination [Thermomonospora echinospora]|uniref:Sporulation and spore germination n=1 Tax=Thermomonospora echinospora TaxID=1992 RepID=A0A1H5WAL4_9ACTN|nr:LpqB family beta-propeller domain-containing protein [Thermomonospora echinospora]SEF96231.1 Sporulation and spore germination [Thermomonospora echinospora]